MLHPGRDCCCKRPAKTDCKRDPPLPGGQRFKPQQRKVTIVDCLTTSVLPDTPGDCSAWLCLPSVSPVDHVAGISIPRHQVFPSLVDCMSLSPLEQLAGGSIDNQLLQGVGSLLGNRAGSRDPSVNKRAINHQRCADATRWASQTGVLLAASSSNCLVCLCHLGHYAHPPQVQSALHAAPHAVCCLPAGS